MRRAANPYAPPDAQSTPGATGTLVSSLPTTVRYSVLMWLTVAAALSYLVRGAVSVSESTIRAELGLSLEQSGWFMGAFFWSYALFQVPAGWWSQRQGTRLTQALFAVAWSAATLMLGLASGFTILIVAQLLMGVAQAGVFPAACNSIAKWMPLSRRSISCAALAIGMQVGAIIASVVTARLLLPIGWRWLFVMTSLPGFAWAAGFWWRFRDDPRRHPRVNDQEVELIRAGSDQVVQPHGHEPSAPWWRMAQHATLWFLCGQQVCRAAGYMFFASWFPTFLQKTRDVPVSQSGYLQALVFSGTLIGSLWGGMLTDWIWRRTGSLRLSRSGVGAAALASCAVLILSAWFVESVALAVSLMAAGSVCAALAGPCAFSATIDVGGQHVPQVFGVMNMTGNLAAAACPVAVGMLFQWTANWDLVLLVFAVVYLCGAASWLLVDPSKRIALTVSE